MKVLLFSTGFPEYMIELSNALADDHEVILMLPENHRLTPMHIQLIDKRVIFEPFSVVFFKSIRQNLKMIRRIIRVINKYRPNILHIQSNGHPWFPLVYFFLSNKTKVINTIHDPIKHLGDRLSLNTNDTLSIWFGKLFTRKYIVHGIFLKQQLSKAYHIKQKKACVIPHGHFGIYKKFQKYHVEGCQNTFLFFGRIWPYKGLEYFLMAANKVIARYPQTTFIVAGSGESIDQYQKIVQFPSNVEFYNYRISLEDAGLFFERCSAVVLPYVDGSQSGVIPLAYAYSKPVIVTNVGSIHEVVDEGVTGFIIPPASVEPLVDRLIFFVENNNKATEMGMHAFLKAQKELSWREIARQTSEVYQSV